MQINALFRKGLVLAVVVLFVGIGIIPITESLSVERHSPVIGSIKEINNLLKTESRGINVTLHGKMGNNGWYVGPVSIEVTADNGTEVVRIQYNLDGGGWKDYTAPFEITTNGYHHLEVKVLDQYGNMWNFSFEIKIDMIHPTVVCNGKRGFNKIVYTANPDDTISGIDRVEFYFSTALQYIAMAPGPYQWTLQPIPHINGTVYVIAYDMAGNWLRMYARTTFGLIQSNKQPSNQHNDHNSQRNSLLRILEGLQ
jgi:hypothetical protein